MLIRVLAGIAFCGVLWVVITMCLSELYKHESRDSELMVPEVIGATIIGLTCAAFLGKFMELDFVTTAIIIGAVTAALWIATLIIWFYKADYAERKKCRQIICKKLNEAFRLVRMFGIASILATVMLPLCRFAAW